MRAPRQAIVNGSRSKGEAQFLRNGQRPGTPGWGIESEENWGKLASGDNVRAIPTEPGDYTGFYVDVANAMRVGGAPPVNPDDAIAAPIRVRRSAGASRKARVNAAARSS